MKEQLQKAQEELQRIEELRASGLYFCSEAEISEYTQFSLSTIINYQYPRPNHSPKHPLPKPAFVFRVGGRKKIRFWLKKDIQEWMETQDDK